MADTFDLQRFVDAQKDVHPQVLRELRAGQKRTHWMWFIFPQIRGLGSSPMAARYAITSLDEARAYLLHDVLGPRLRECMALVNAVEGRGVSDIFGYPDDLKLHSSMTLFAHAETGAENVFRASLVKHFHGVEDGATVSRI